MGKLIKNAFRLTVAVGIVSGVAYAFKDEIKESKVYKDYEVDEKLKKASKYVKDKTAKFFPKEEDLVDDDELFFEGESDVAQDASSKEYISLDGEKKSSGIKTIINKITEKVAEREAEATEEAEEAVEVAEETAEETAEEVSEDIPTIQA